MGGIRLPGEFHLVIVCPLLRIRDSHRLGGDGSVPGFDPESRVERNGIDQLLLRDILEHSGDSILHVADRGHRARLAARKVLIIPHHNHIIRNNSLFFQVIEAVVSRRNIVVHGQDNTFLAARDR